MRLMPIEKIEDWEQRLARQDAFWEREIIDRPPVSIAIRKPNPSHPYPPKKQWPTWRDRWLDFDYIIESTKARVANTDFLGDALPTAWPNLGPDIFSAFFGTELGFSETTSWSTPNLDSLDQIDDITINLDSFYWKKLLEFTDALMEAGKGQFYTGITDLHVGGDCVAAFRDPERLSIDLIEQPDDIARLLEKITQAYFRAIDFFFEKLIAKGQAITTWLSIVSSRKWYVPSNDYSCMISSQMFNEIFLPGIAEECRHLEAAIYHLDGPNALQHLDSLLQIPDLNAVQWVWGAGHGKASDWLHVFKRIQSAQKGIWLNCHVDELDLFMENLKPQGVFLHLGGVTSREHATAVLQKVTAWR